MERFMKVCRLRRVEILALIHLFFVNAAADCQKPKATEKFVLSKAALLSNSFPEGVHETFECANGYKRVDGSGTTVCSNGQWSEPDLICEENDCGPPKPEPNTRFNISEGTRFRAKMKVFCDKGYKLTGSSSRRCYATGWIGSSKCLIQTCDKPGQVTNGRSSWSSEDRPKYGETIQYQCNQGYTLVGKEEIECTETSKYDSQPPECKDAATTVLVTSTPPPAVTEASTNSSVATATAPTDSTTTSSAATAVSSSARGNLHVPNTEGEGAAASVPSTTSLEGLNKEVLDTSTHIGYIAFTFGILCTVLVILIIGFAVRKFLLGRKGSYDTREDLKPELSHFHNL